MHLWDEAAADMDTGSPLRTLLPPVYSQRILKVYLPFMRASDELKPKQVDGLRARGESLLGEWSFHYLGH
jgi:hypothetical protein